MSPEISITIGILGFALLAYGFMWCRIVGPETRRERIARRLKADYRLSR